MATVTISEEHGVRLLFCDVKAEEASGTGGPHYRITSRRKVQPVVRVDRAEAEACFRQEVDASKRDRLIAEIVRRGL